jgi:hypothetical protein
MKELSTLRIPYGMRAVEMLHTGNAGLWRFARPRPQVSMSMELQGRCMSDAGMHYLWLLGFWKHREDKTRKTYGGKFHVRKTTKYHASDRKLSKAALQNNG